jgi:hypothetical protein
MKCPAYLCAESDICLLPKYHKLLSEMKKDLEPEKPGVILCQECGRKLTQGSPSCVRCGKCARARREIK